jgi:hypothetical protein
MYIMHSCLLSHKHEQLLLRTYFLNPYFQGQKHFWAKCAQIGYNFIFYQFISFAFLIINVKIIFN